MDIKVKSTPNLKATIARVCPGDISLESGIKLLIELVNAEGIIIDKKYLEIPQLPAITVNSREVNTVDFLKSKALELVGLEEDLGQ